MGHAVAAKLLRLLDAEAHDEEHQGEDDADAQEGAPLRTVMAIVAGCCHNVGHKCTSDKADVDSRVGEEDEPAVARAGLELGAGLRTADGTGRVLATDTDPDAGIMV